MAAAAAVIGFLCIIIVNSSGQRLYGGSNNRICRDVTCTTKLQSLDILNGCRVVLGNLKILTIENTTISSFRNISFPELREITGFMLVYRVSGLESMGQLFPNLTRIRGLQVFDNFGLIVYDVPNLRNIGLYSLLKIDRGGVTMWGGPHTCFVMTVDWNSIAPKSRHVLTPAEKNARCNFQCTCSTNMSTNHCWSNRKCQRYLEGPDGERCNDQCLGCRKTNKDECSLCRHYTYRGQCVPKCPNDTIILSDIQYCITEKECKQLHGWSWNNTCIFECPLDYSMNKMKGGNITCKPCLDCHRTCHSLNIQILNHLQKGKPCVFINGSLTIHLRAVPDVMQELRKYLSRVQEVRDYIVIYGSITITSLDFLSSLRVIRGAKLANNSYSLIVRDMVNLQTLFSPNIAKNLKINGGKLKILRNPVLCMSKIEELSRQFPVKADKSDIPVHMNGYSGGCEEASVGLKVKVWNETSATVIFSPLSDTNIEYTILYVRLPPGTRTTIVPETCSDSEWFAVSASSNGLVDLKSLRPASTYAICIETYSYSFESKEKHLARSNIINFTTPVGKPAPPFIIELVASSSEAVVLRWVDHKDYRPHINRYEIDAVLIEIHPEDVTARDHCNSDDVFEDTEYSRHAVVLKPPPDYDRGCESMCGILSTATAGAMAEEHFDICDSLDFDCDRYDDKYLRTNSSFGNYVRTIALDIRGPRNNYQVGSLAPFRDYKFMVRSCVGDNCSRPTRSVVRTLRSSKADIPIVTSYNVNDTGHFFVKWKPPDLTNGPVLAYSIHILSYIASDVGFILPQAWCVLPDIFNLTVKSQYVSNYKVRVCSTTLGSFNACSEWHRYLVPEFNNKLLRIVPELSNSFLWGGLFFGVCIIVISSMLAYIFNRRSDISETSLLLDSASTERNESEPPVIMLTDFVPLYAVPLRDTLLDY